MSHTPLFKLDQRVKELEEGGVGGGISEDKLITSEKLNTIITLDDETVMSSKCVQEFLDNRTLQEMTEEDEDSGKIPTASCVRNFVESFVKLGENGEGVQINLDDVVQKDTDVAKNYTSTLGDTLVMTFGATKGYVEANAASKDHEHTLEDITGFDDAVKEVLDENTLHDSSSVSTDGTKLIREKDLVSYVEGQDFIPSSSLITSLSSSPTDTQIVSAKGIKTYVDTKVSSSSSSNQNVITEVPSSFENLNDDDLISFGVVKAFIQQQINEALAIKNS